MEFKYWCPGCKKTILREGFRLRRKSYCVDTGREMIYFKGLMWVGWLLFAGVVARVVYYCAAIILKLLILVGLTWRG
ncbi:hypothetical protein KA005_34270 [bacterium]|nr:hypothetical protein [bacterium]